MHCQLFPSSPQEKEQSRAEWRTQPLASGMGAAPHTGSGHSSRAQTGDALPSAADTSGTSVSGVPEVPQPSPGMDPQHPEQAAPPFPVGLRSQGPDRVWRHRHLTCRLKTANTSTQPRFLGSGTARQTCLLDASHLPSTGRAGTAAEQGFVPCQSAALGVYL